MPLFPTSPTNLQIANVNGITYQYNTANATWTRIPGSISSLTVSGNIYSGNLGTSGTLSVGSVTGNLNPSANVAYSLGNTTNRWKDLWISNSTIYLGEVALATNGTALTINGSNVITGNAGSTFSTSGNVTGGNILTTGTVSATGNVVGTYFIGNGALLSGISSGTPSRIANGTSNVDAVASNGNITVGIGGTGNVAVFATTGEYVTGEMSATGNITGNYIFGNGSQLTGITASGGNVTVSPTPPSSPLVGDVWIDSDTGTPYLYYAATNNGANSQWAETSSLYSFSSTSTGGGGTPGGNTTEVQFNSSGTFAGSPNFTFDGSSVVVAGNITGNYILGNGSQLTGLPATYSNTNVSSFLADFGSNTISTTGAITAGNITGGNLLTSGVASASSFIGSVVSVSGNVTGGTASATGNITGGNILTGGLVSAASHIGSVVSVTGAVTAASTVGGIITGSSASVTGTVTAASTVGGVITGSSASVTGNVNGGNLISTALVQGATVSSTGSVNDSLGSVRDIPQNTQTANPYTLTNTDDGKYISYGTTSGVVTVPASVYSAGQATTIFNNTTSNITIAQGASVTLRLAGTATTGNRTLAQYGLTTLLCVAANTFVISGAGLT